MKRLLFLFTVLFSTACNAAQIHMIYVGNFYDPSIGLGVKFDVLNMFTMIEKYEKAAELKVSHTGFFGSNATPEKVLNFIKNDFKCGPDDTIIFYFSGHGYQLSSKKDEGNPWPNLYGSDGTACDFQWVNTLLKEKNPRLLISIADCCNNILPDFGWFFNWLNHPTVVRSFLDEELVKEKIQNLFFRTKGHIIASGSHSGEYSFVFPFFDEDVEEITEDESGISINNINAKKYGSLFTCYLIQTLNRAIYSFDQEISWISIMKQVTKKCVDHPRLNAMGMSQTPMYDIHLAQIEKTNSE